MRLDGPQSDLGRNTLALALLVTSSMIWSVIPVTMTATGLQATLLYVALYRAGGAAGAALSMAAVYPDLTRRHANPFRSLPQAFKKTTLLAWALVSVTKLEWLLFIHALANIPSHIAVLTFQIWPVAMIAGLHLMNRRTGRYSRSGSLTIPALAVCVAGTAMVAVPGATGDPTTGPSLAGVAAAFGAALMASTQNAGIVLWGDAAARQVEKNDEDRTQAARHRAFFSSWMQATGQLGAMAIVLVAAWVLGSGIGPLEAATALALGFATAGLGDTVFRAGTAVAAHPALISACYSEPVFSLLWLQLAYGLTIDNPALTAGGLVLIIAANALITNGGHRPGRRWRKHC